MTSIVSSPGQRELNLCRPDRWKSCAACCGLYNVADATRPTLQRNLETRTFLFQQVLRTPDALQEFKDSTRVREAVAPLERVIHVCEFAGFLDANQNVVGCMLHPSATGNNGIDLRGMCHYGSMACKMFFCPAWNELSGEHLRILIAVVQDWHLFGLVVTDVDFVAALFHVLEEVVGCPLDAGKLLASDDAGEVFKEMLAWKDTWPFRGDSTVRRNRYYCKRNAKDTAWDRGKQIEVLTDILRFTYDLERTTDEWEPYIVQTIQRFAETYPVSRTSRQE